MKKVIRLSMLSLALIGTLALAACNSTTNTATESASATAEAASATTEAASATEEATSATTEAATATEEATTETASATEEITSETVDIVENITFNYMKRDELKNIIDNATPGYMLLDVRKADDYKKDHIINSINADMDKAKDGDIADGVINLKAALQTATGNENGTDDEKYVLLCYSGKRYAEAATEALVSMGINNENIYILEGGYKEWLSDSNTDYTNLIVTGTEN